MHIGLNLVYLVPGEIGGMETYARELIARLAGREGLRLTAFINREAAAAENGALPPEVEVRVVPVHARSRLQWVRGEQQLLPPLAARAGCDLVHSMASTGPVWGRFVRVTTVHDLSYRVIPESHGVRALGMRVLVPAAARRSRRVIADSGQTAADIERYIGLPAERIDVIPLGVGLTARATPLAEPDLRARFELGERPLLLCVSAKRPHKNLERLVEAVGRIDPARRPITVLTGYRTPWEDALRARVDELGLGGDVRIVGWVSDGELEGLYAAASCFAFPSLYEGFGLPVLEAMSRGVPVTCSDRGSLAEVAGDAALIFDPEDPAAIAGAVERVLGDADLAARLRRAGRERAAGFTWERTAERTLETYRRALGSPAG